jgi:Tfp pilus assembly protein PilF
MEQTRFYFLMAPTMCGRLVSPFLSAVLSLAFASFPECLLAQAPGGSITGQVRIAPGNELKSPVMVTLVGRGVTVKELYTDGEGRFGFNGLPGSLYHVMINDDGYSAVDQEVRIDPVSSSTVAILNIYLTPRQLVDPEGTSTVRGGNSHLTNPSEYTQNIPNAAVKEFSKGVKFDQGGKPEQAICHYQRAIELAPDFYAARNNLGSDLLNKSQFLDAQQQFEKVIKLNPSDAAGYFNLGNLYLLTHQNEKAEELVKQGLSKQPDSAFGYFLKGSLYSRAGKLGEAEAAMRRCLELNPFMSKAHLALVNTYIQQQRTNDALSELRLFLRSFPEDPLAPKARQVLEKLEATNGKMDR